MDSGGDAAVRAGGKFAVTENGFDRPNYTQIPNELLDGLMSDMVGSELKVTLALCRKTFGWHKKRDVVSLSQLEKITGLTRQAVLDGLVRGMKRGTIQRVRAGKQSYSYEVVITEADPTSLKTRPVEEATSLKTRPVTSLKSRHTKETTKEIPKRAQAPQAYDAFVVWCDVLGYDANKVSKTKKGQELRYAKELLGASWVLEEIRGCLAELAQQDFWQDKPLSLCHVAKEINAWKHRRTTKRSIAM